MDALRIHLPEAGIRVYPGSVYHVIRKHASPSLLLGYGSILEEDIAPEVKHLAELVRARS